MSLPAALNPKLHLITGKGGVGRTSVAISLAKAFALKGERVLLLETRDEEGGASALGRALGLGERLPSASAPRRLSAELLRDGLSSELLSSCEAAGSLYAAQLVAREGHERFLSSMLPVERLVKAALQSQGLSRFLNAAPSMYELGLFYHLWSVVDQGAFSKVVMDLPATGHTLALTRLPGQIERMVPVGPVTEGLRSGKAVIADPEQASLWVVALPERLPVSEALELSEALEGDELVTAAFILNRAPLRGTPPAELEATRRWLSERSAAELGALSSLRSQLERAAALPALSQELRARAPIFLLDEQGREAERTASLLAWFESREPERDPQRAQSSPESPPAQELEGALGGERALMHLSLNADEARARAELRKSLLSQSVIVCCGAGGVGKTTSSAALALAGAQLGRRVLVLTIDPSKRLAQALGVSRNTPSPVPLSEERLEALGVSSGRLSAWLLDPQHVSDGVVRREAREQASALMSNLIYREVSGMVAGMQEYTAVEALRGFVKDRAYDLIVLDTPPARHALRFLDAPERVAGFLDKRIFKLFVPDRTGLMGRIAGRVIDEVLERAFGVKTRDELKQFFELFSQILDHLNGNQQEMKAFFRSELISFYLVTTPHQEVIEEASYFREQVQERALKFGGLILNRSSAVEARGAELEAQLEALAALAPKLTERLSAQLLTAQRERLELSAQLKRLSAEAPMIRVPELGQRAARLEGLAALAEALSTLPDDDQ